LLLNPAPASLPHGGVLLLNPPDLPIGRGWPPLQFSTGFRTLPRQIQWRTLLPSLGKGLKVRVPQIDEWEQAFRDYLSTRVLTSLAQGSSVKVVFWYGRSYNAKFIDRYVFSNLVSCSASHGFVEERNSVMWTTLTSDVASRICAEFPGAQGNYYSDIAGRLLRTLELRV
jgi:hypothetical protein